jgi:hypothetical protein
MWQYEVPLAPGQVKNIWFEDGTYSSSIPNNGGVNIQNLGAYPASTTTTTGVPIPSYSNSKKSIAFTSTLTNSTNFALSFFNYESLRIVGPVDTGFDSDVWYQDDSVYPLTNSGYNFTLYRNSPSNAAATIFFNYKGDNIGQYSAETDNYNYGSLNGKFMYFIDRTNGILRYSDGVGVVNFEFDNTNTFYIETSYDDCNKDGFIVYSGSGDFYSYLLMTMDGPITLYNWDSNYYDVGILNYSNGNFIPLIVYNVDNTYSFMNIYSSKGVLLQQINLTNGDPYNDFDLVFYGTNKMNIVFYNEFDINIGYKIFNYDGETNTLISTTHNRGTEYANWVQYYREFYGGDNHYPSENIQILLFDNSGGWNGSLYSVAYADFISYFSGDTSYRSSYTFQDSGSWDKYLTIYGGYSNEYFQIPCDNGDGYISVLNILKTSQSYTPLCTKSTVDADFWYYYIGDYFAIVTFTVYNSEGTIFVLESDGSIKSSQPFLGGFSITTNYNTLYMYDSNNSWYLNESTISFTEIPNYNNTYIPVTYYTPTFESDGNILLVNTSEYKAKVITRTGISSEVTLPNDGNGYGIRIGKDLVLYYYYNSYNNIIMKLYDLKLNQLTSISTNETDENNFGIIENRAFIQTYSNSQITDYMIMPLVHKTVTMSDYSSEYTPNDYYWWWD